MIGPQIARTGVDVPGERGAGLFSGWRERTGLHGTQRAVSGCMITGGNFSRARMGGCAN